MLGEANPGSQVAGLRIIVHPKRGVNHFGFSPLIFRQFFIIPYRRLRLVKELLQISPVFSLQQCLRGQ